MLMLIFLLQVYFILDIITTNIMNQNLCILIIELLYYKFLKYDSTNVSFIKIQIGSKHEKQKEKCIGMLHCTENQG